MKSVLLSMVLTAIGFAQSGPLLGRWQGAILVGQQPVRVVVRLEERAGGGLDCLVNFIERQFEPYRCTSITADGDRLSVSVESMGRIEGRLAERGAVLEGTFSFPSGASQTLRLERATEATAWTLPMPPHEQRFVTVSDGARLEVLDFGGEGPPLIFIPGLGNAAHVFDAFAPRLTDSHRVYAITRRGSGESDKPAPSPEAYGSRRLGDDVLDVMDALKIERAVLAGWSIGGVELSSVASRFPNRVRGLVYLDGAWAYSFYARGNQQNDQNLWIGLNDLSARLAAARTLPSAQAAEIMEQILNVTLPDLSHDIALRRDRLREIARTSPPEPPPPRPPPSPNSQAAPTSTAINDAILRGGERFPALKVPILAIYADIPPVAGWTAVQKAGFQRDMADRAEMIGRFKAAHPQAKVVVLKGQHTIFISNPEEVLREMRAFLQALPN